MTAGFAVSIEDLRVTAEVFARVAGEAAAAVGTASAVVAGAAGMAGDDAVLARWRGRYDPVALAVWTATGAVTDTFGAIAGRLVASGNAYLAAEHAVGAAGPPPRLPDLPSDHALAPFPPASAGPTGIAVPDELAAFWPGGDPALLRTAATAWRDLADDLDQAARHGDNAFRGLLGANSGGGFSAMATFWSRHYENCGRDPLFNAVPTGARLLGHSCGGLADLIDDTRSLVGSAAAAAAEDLSGFDLPAHILGRFTRGATDAVLLAGKAALAGGYLESYRDAYLRGLDQLIAQLDAADQTHLERLSAPPPVAVAVEVGLGDVGEIVDLGLSGSAWDGVAASNNIAPPTPNTIHLTPTRVIHILDGDSPTSGGHRAGTGSPNKTEFPRIWSDEEILRAIMAVARGPGVVPVHQDNYRWRASGVVDGVTINVIVAPDGEIVTAFPVSGPGVVKNPPSS